MGKGGLAFLFQGSSRYRTLRDEVKGMLPSAHPASGRRWPALVRRGSGDGLPSCWELACGVPESREGAGFGCGGLAFFVSGDLPLPHAP